MQKNKHPICYIHVTDQPTGVTLSRPVYKLSDLIREIFFFLFQREDIAILINQSKF